VLRRAKLSPDLGIDLPPISDPRSRSDGCSQIPRLDPVLALLAAQRRAECCPVPVR